MIRLILCASLLCLVSCDLFCVEKQQLGDGPGILYSIAETCERCACDGQGSKFCSKDYACQKKKDASNRRPCFFAANKIPHGSQIQVDCNICACKNTTMVCTQDPCHGIESTADKKAKVEKELEQTSDKKCEDSDKNCFYWSKKGLCNTNKVVKNKCARACGVCTAAPKKTAATVIAKCEDTDDRCKAWYQRGGLNLCNKNTFMKKNCKSSCNKCPGQSQPSAPKAEACIDADTKCLAWSKREGLCESSGYLKKKCKMSCNLCPEVVVEKEVEVSQSTEEECLDINEHCPAWAGAGHCAKSKYVEKNCRVSCKVCTPVHVVVEAAVVNEVAAAVAEVVNKQLTFEEEWRLRLIAEGKLKVDTGPQGCTFREGGKLYPWGSSIQGGCGICKCRKKTDDTYYFDCDEC